MYLFPVWSESPCSFSMLQEYLQANGKDAWSYIWSPSWGANSGECYFWASSHSSPANAHGLGNKRDFIWGEGNSFLSPGETHTLKSLAAVTWTAWAELKEVFQCVGRMMRHTKRMDFRIMSCFLMSRDGNPGISAEMLCKWQHFGAWVQPSERIIL